MKKKDNTPQRMVILTKAEVDSLKEFCDYNLEVGSVEITQNSSSGIGLITNVQVRNLPETLTDITDIDSW